MFNRGLFLLFLAGAVAVPYLLTKSSVLEKVGITAAADDAHPAADSALAPATAAASAALTQAASATPVDQPPGHDLLVPRPQQLDDALRFDLTTADIFARWPRVTTRVAGLEMQGFRVPLVSGTAADDLAGSLTYYFDAQQRLQRIVFFGTTGNPRKLVALVTRRFQFMRRENDDPGLQLYQVRHGRKTASELRIRTAEVIQAHQPHARYEIALWIARPPA